MRNNKIGKRHARKIIMELHGKKAKKLKLLGQGCYGKVYEVFFRDNPDSLVLKMYLSDNLCKSEAETLKLFKQLTNIPVPNIYDVLEKKGENDIEAIVMGKINGETINQIKNISEDKKVSIANKAVDKILELHKIEGDFYGEIVGNRRYSTWGEYYKSIISEVLEGLSNLVEEGKYPRSLYERVLKVSKEFDGLIKDVTIKPCLLHGDLKPKNIMVYNDEISAIIDPCDSCYGDIAFDARQLLKNNGNEFKLLETYKIRTGNDNQAFQKRIMFYILINDIRHMLKSGIFFHDSTEWALECFSV